MKWPVYFIDTFTSTPFKGNPTAVCYVEQDAPAQTMQSVATELNCPVTAFVSRRAGHTAAYNIHYFTATTVIPACGHATLAAAMVVNRRDGNATATFHTINAVLIETVIEGTIIMMHYPTYAMENYVVSKPLLESIGLSYYKTAGYSAPLETLFIEIDDPALLRTVQPDYAKLVECNQEIKEVVITAASDDSRYDYLLRSFCPWIGIDEDPVTGSVHTVLAGFWAQRLHKNILRAYQASRRGGELLVKSLGERVGIGGEAILILDGLIEI
jgi:PhzF family phenazine biosynthesis protein